jgi:HlyD family secretion protein
MKKALKIGGILLVAAILIGAGAILITRSERAGTAEAAPATATVEVGYIEETVSATGNVTAKSDASLAFESSGPIAEVAASEGQHVEAGQVLARLATSSLEWQVARSEASLNSALARLEQARKAPTDEEMDSAEAALDSAIAAYDKVAAGSSAEDLASAQAALDSAQAAYKKVKAGPTNEDLAAVRAGIEIAQASLQQAQASYDKIKDRPDAQMLPQALSLQNATIEMERAQANYDSIANHPTESESASARAQVAQAEAQLALLQDRPTVSELASARAQVAQAEAQVAQLEARPSDVDIAVSEAAVEETRIALAQAQSQLNDALLTAPFAGTVLAVNVSAGEFVSPGAPAIMLGATEMILDVNIDEIDVAQLAEGQAAHLSFDALKDEVFSGSLTHIAPSSTNVGGAVAYAVEISLDPEGRPVRLGMTADVDIVTDSAEGALLVPNRAIEADREAGRYYVIRQLADGTIQRLEVRIGLRDQTHTQILEGVEEGDQLVLPELPNQTESDTFMGPGSGGGMFSGG